MQKCKLDEWQLPHRKETVNIISICIYQRPDSRPLVVLVVVKFFFTYDVLVIHLSCGKAWSTTFGLL